MKQLLCIFLTLTTAASLMTACTKQQPSQKPKPADAGVQQSAPAESALPEPVQEKPYNPALLTGLEKGEAYPEGQRFTAVMVNNISENGVQQARPQAGLSEADVLVEIKVEGGITRFMALYENFKTMPRVGPVRSARDQFFQLILPLRPMYVHVGESIVQKEYKNNYDYHDFDLDGDSIAALGHRDQEFIARGVAREHTFVTSGQEITASIEKNTSKNPSITPYKSTIFDFVRYDEPPRVLRGAEAEKIDIVHSDGYKTYFEWDPAQKKYLMSQYSRAAGGVKPSVDANNGQQLTFDNVIVLFTDIHVYPGHEAKDLQEVVYDHGGVGYYFSGGRSEEIRWQKGPADQVLRLVNDDAELSNVKVNPGKTYLAVVDLDKSKEFGYYPPQTQQQ